MDVHTSIAHVKVQHAGTACRLDTQARHGAIWMHRHYHDADQYPTIKACERMQSFDYEKTCMQGRPRGVHGPPLRAMS